MKLVHLLTLLFLPILFGVSHLLLLSFLIYNLHFSDEKFYCYVEILSALFCCFLRSVRVAEHTVSSTVQEKFNKALEDLKLNLTKFGEMLLNREHVS